MSDELFCDPCEQDNGAWLNCSLSHMSRLEKKESKTIQLNWNTGLSRNKLKLSKTWKFLENIRLSRFSFIKDPIFFIGSPSLSTINVFKRFSFCKWKLRMTVRMRWQKKEQNAKAHEWVLRNSACSLVFFTGLCDKKKTTTKKRSVAIEKLRRAQKRWNKAVALTKDLNCTTHGREKRFAFEEPTCGVLHDTKEKCGFQSKRTWYKINSTSFVRRKASIVSSAFSFAIWVTKIVFCPPLGNKILE